MSFASPLPGNRTFGSSQSPITVVDQFTGFDQLTEDHRQCRDTTAHLGFERRPRFGAHRADDFFGVGLRFAFRGRCLNRRDGKLGCTAR